LIRAQKPLSLNPADAAPSAENQINIKNENDYKNHQRQLASLKQYKHQTGRETSEHNQNFV
jgi:hypothetical protein